MRTGSIGLRVVGLVMLACLAVTSSGGKAPVRRRCADRCSCRPGLATSDRSNVGACAVADGLARFAVGIGAAFRIDVASATRGRPYVLPPERPAELEITFTGRSIAMRNGSTDGMPPADGTYATLGATQGIVPGWAEEAVVCLVIGSPTDPL